MKTFFDLCRCYSGMYVDTMYYIPCISGLGPVMVMGYFSFPHVISAEPADMICSFTSSLRDFHSNSSVKFGSADIPTMPATRSGRRMAIRKEIHVPMPWPTKICCANKIRFVYANYGTMHACMYVCMYVHIYGY